MTASDPVKALASLLKKLEDKVRPQGVPLPDPALIDPAEPLLAEFLRSFLLWDASAGAAEAALKRIARQVVDFNELRVCLPDEIVSMLGAGYPRVQERALRLRAALNELYLREHAVTLEPITSMSKRDAKAYLDSLEGVPHFVASRVCLVCLGVHAAPVDDRILRRLVEGAVLPADATPESGAAALERKIRAGEMLQAYALLQCWADQLGDLPLALPPSVAPAAAGGAGGAGGAGKPASGRAAGNGIVSKTRAARTPKPRKPGKR